MERLENGLNWLLLAILCAAVLAVFPEARADQTAPAAKQYRGILTREAHFVNGLDAPIPMYAAQIEQESGWRPGITAWDGGKGLAQFMDGTASDIARLYTAIGKPAPMKPTWAIQALVRYDTRIIGSVQGIDACNRRAAGLKGYNAGPGYVMQAQKVSPQPGQWWGVTEYIKTRQTPQNFEASRMYPRWIILQRQPKYTGWGAYTCEGFNP